MSALRRDEARALSWSVVMTVARRPDLWWAALGALRRLAAPGWWRRRPYVPLPDRRLWAFRMVTAYGRPDADPTPEDVVSYLEWCRSTAPRRWAPAGTGWGDGGTSTRSGGQSG